MPAESLALCALAQSKKGLPADILWEAEGFVLGWWAAFALLKFGKGKTLPSFTPKLLHLDQGAPCESVYPAARVFSWDGCLGAVQGPGCTGSRICPRMFIGNLHMQQKSPEGPCSRGLPVLGEGQPE